MPLPSSGPINFSEVNVELGLITTAQISLNDASVRTLFQVPSGEISMSNGYGKSNRATASQTFATNSTNQTVNIATLPGYVAGSTDVTITVNAGVYVYSTTTGTSGLTITGGVAGDTCTLINNGFILGIGGRGDSYNGNNTRVVGTAGGDALSLGRNVTIQNNSFIAGGGGGGGAGGAINAGGGSLTGGGGGAGGGAGGNTWHRSVRGNCAPAGGAGGGPGAAGSNGTAVANQNGSGAGGGGRILPGTGGASAAAGGAPGGGGAGGGGGNGPAIASGGQIITYGASGGGGGWGASGGTGFFAGTGASGAGGSANNNGGNGAGSTSQFAGQAGGRGVALNGFTATFTVQGTVYGAVS